MKASKRIASEYDLNSNLLEGHEKAEAAWSLKP